MTLGNGLMLLGLHMLICIMGMIDPLSSGKLQFNEFKASLRHMDLKGRQTNEPTTKRHIHVKLTRRYLSIGENTKDSGAGILYITR